MRAGAGAFVAVAASVALLLPGCGSSASNPKPDLFREYTRSSNVKNDRFPTEGASGEDRLANFAAHYTPEQLLSELLSAFPCDGGDGSESYDTWGIPQCHLNGAVNEAIRDVAGSDGEVFGRSILVKHEDGSLELMTLYVVRKPDKTAQLIDATGEAYSGGLDDFRQHNDLLSSKDYILAPVNIASVPGEGRIVTVSGHTPANWQPWLIGGIVAVIVLGAGLVVARRLVARRRVLDADLDWAD